MRHPFWLPSTPSAPSTASGLASQAAWCLCVSVSVSVSTSWCLCATCCACAVFVTVLCCVCHRAHAPVWWFCVSEKDCGDGSDEKNCPKPTG